MGGYWGLLPLYADFHLIPEWCHFFVFSGWFPGCPSLESLVHPVQMINLQSSAGVVTAPVWFQPPLCSHLQRKPESPVVEVWKGLRSDLPCAVLIVLHRSQSLLTFQSLVIYLICSLPAAFSLGVLVFPNCQSEKWYSTDSSQTAWVRILALPPISCGNLGKFLKH